MKSKEPFWSRLRRRWRKWLQARIEPVPSNVLWLSTVCHITIGPEDDGCRILGIVVTIAPRTNRSVAHGFVRKQYGPFPYQAGVDLLELCAAAYIAESPHIGFPR